MNFKEIIRKEEIECESDSYYKELLKKDIHDALAFKYGYVTNGLARQIRNLNK